MARQHNQTPVCLMYRDKKTNTYQPVPLKKILYDVEIRGPLAEVKLIQHYTNDDDETINVTYEFPITEDACFTGFEASFWDRTVSGVIKEKNEAKAEFEFHQQIGSTVAFSQKKDNEEDIIKIELGNLPAREHLTIKLTYIEQLDLVRSQFWRLVIPVAMTPRYHSISPSEPKSLFGSTSEDRGLSERGLFSSPKQEKENFVCTTEKPYTWEINVLVVQTEQDGKMFCPTHADSVDATRVVNNGITNTRVVLRTPEVPNKDFELVFSDSSFNSPTIEVMQHPLNQEGGFPLKCAMMHFVPNFSPFATITEEGKEVIDETGELVSLMENTMGEYYFILDRSGSMSGERIEMAKKALELALRSLPYDSYFNIVSFGTDFSFLYPTSVKNCNVSVKAAIERIKSFKADFGGTEIMGPITACFHAPVKPNYQKTILLLTDGSVSDGKTLIQKTRENCVMNKNRVFTIGIGNGVSEQLIKGMARAGNGSFEIIQNTKVLDDKVISLIKSSCTPAMTNFRVQFDSNAIQAITPLLTSQSQVLSDKPLQIFAALKNGWTQTTEVKVTYYDSTVKKDKEISFLIDPSKIDGFKDHYHKLLVRNLIRDSEYGLDPNMPTGDWQTPLAVRYQVLCPKTAFICVINDAREFGSDHATKNIIVPQIQSVDYETNPISSGGLNFLKKKSWHCGSLKKISESFQKEMRNNQNQTLKEGAKRRYYQELVPFSAALIPEQSIISDSSSNFSSNNNINLSSHLDHSVPSGDLHTSYKLDNLIDNQNNYILNRTKESRIDTEVSSKIKEKTESVKFEGTNGKYRGFDLFSDDEDGCNEESIINRKVDESSKQHTKDESVPINSAQGYKKTTTRNQEEEETYLKTDPSSLINLQNTDTGEFAFDETILIQIFNSFKSHMESSSTSRNLFMTICAVVWMRKYHKDLKYKIILHKSIQYLKQNAIELENIENAISELL